jgi:hypothetical protein
MAQQHRMSVSDTKGSGSMDLDGLPSSRTGLMFQAMEQPVSNQLSPTLEHMV